MNYITWAYNLPDKSRLKYLDESHFEPKGHLSRKARGPEGETTVLINDVLLSKSFSITLLTTPTHTRPFILDIREGSNTQWDFLAFVKYAVAAGYLVAGDILIMDNARVHTVTTMLDTLEVLLHSHDIKFFFFPTYSPELNPCEMIFGLVKAKMRKTHDSHTPYKLQIILSFTGIRHQVVYRFYCRCIW
eukprot:CAMPEP_0174257486 /NCGR_PEP_ID=MMETSP0439-20130205/6612_1 /TAXON_ID=0 /ORGANISM="Stereomyxa ramosa, Strain Chinc5" /LENGTH=188 /DNA_ID=CAMNT_0015340581 /DNA_START=511 /DNA_END=1074 /DNA_ORIENTATION=-